MIHVIEGQVTRLEESPGVPRRQWPDAVKERLVAACEPGVNVSALARAHGVTPQLLFAWRSRSRKRAAALAAPPKIESSTATAFAEVAVISSQDGGMVEVVVGSVVLRGGLDVRPDRVTALVRAVREA